MDLGSWARGFSAIRDLRARSVSATGGDTQGLGAEREGGIAHDGWNPAFHVGDDSQCAHCHHCQLEELLGPDQRRHLAWMNQAHSAVVATAQTGDVPTADILVLDPRTGRAPIGCYVLVADCVLVLLASQDGALTVAVHAGRRGILDGVVPVTIDFLRRSGAEPADPWATMGPSVCGSCYGIPEEMFVLSAQRKPTYALHTSQETPGLDVTAGVLAQLERAGIGRINADQQCTYEDPRFFSYRRDGVIGYLAGIGIPR